MLVHVGCINSSPLSVDTEKDLINIKKLMKHPPDANLDMSISR